MRAIPPSRTHHRHPNRFRGGWAGVVALAFPLVVPASAAAAGEPAGGAALDQAIGASLGAIVVSAALGWLLVRHRAGRPTPLAGLARFSERVSGLPGWAALPSGIGAGALLTALLGMYWDISLHIDQGRDAGPLANPAHYLILIGLFGIFAAGCLAVSLPVGERPGPAPLRLAPGWYAPVGGVLMAAAGAFALVGFPLDDVWHRLFGQDVTLWGPTHLMLIGGAGMTLVGQALLLHEGMRDRRERLGSGSGSGAGAPGWRSKAVTYARRTAIMGGLLIGLSTFQGEFDFGVPQFRAVFHPVLIAVAAGMALVAARLWVGPGGALGAALFFLAVRGAVSLIVGPVLGQTTPALPLYLGEALCVEAVALALARRPLALGAAGGLLAGTVGVASEWPWTQLVMRTPWTADLLPEGLVAAAVAGMAGGVVGGLLGAGLRGRLPRPAVARTAFVASLLAVGALVAFGLSTQRPDGVRGSVTLADVRPAPQREAIATVRVHPPALAEDPAWLNVTAWQGGGLVVAPLQPAGRGVYRSTRPVPLHGDWKALVRLHDGSTLLALPVFLPRDAAIPAAEIPAPAAMTRAFGSETALLQRERKQGVPGSLFAGAALVVLAIALAFIWALAWGVARVARPGPAPPPPASSRARPTAPAAIGA